MGLIRRRMSSVTVLQIGLSLLGVVLSAFAWLSLLAVCALGG
jgi:hypothetical protein